MTNRTLLTDWFGRMLPDGKKERFEMFFNNQKECNVGSIDFLTLLLTDV